MQARGPGPAAPFSRKGGPARREELFSHCAASLSKKNNVQPGATGITHESYTLYAYYIGFRRKIQRDFSTKNFSPPLYHCHAWLPEGAA